MNGQPQIWKFEIAKVGGPIEVQGPNLGRAVHFGIQDARFCVWCPVVPGEPNRTASFLIVGTGWDIPCGYSHVSSLQDGPYVWHLMATPPARNPAGSSEGER